MCKKCSKQSLKPIDNKYVYEWGGWMMKWKIIGENKKCNKCKTEFISYNNINSCSVCVKKEFNNKWKKSTPSEKLRFYGLKKLYRLAKKKKIKGRSKMNKNELINNLKDIVIHEDFPIR